MALKLLLDIKGELFDMWEVRTITRWQEYNVLRAEQDYYIQLNREGRATNAENILILCESEEDRNETLADVRVRLALLDQITIF